MARSEATELLFMELSISEVAKVGARIDYQMSFYGEITT